MRYGFRCPTHGERDIERSVDEAANPASCPDCGATMRRLYRVSNCIVRPLYYNARPGDRNFSNFDREAELGEIRSNGDKPESGGARVEIPRPRIDHSTASVAAERNLRQAVEAAWNAAQ